MAERTNRGVALLSIHPRHAESILSGRKKVEFRRVPFKRNLTHVVVYATAPVSQVIGWFTVKEIDMRSPAALWRSYASVSGISAAEFTAYFEGVAHGVAIRVGRAKRLQRPVKLRRLAGALTPPQSYRYLDPSSLDRLTAA